MKPLLTVRDVADSLGLSDDKVYQHVHRGDFKAYRIGSSIRIDPDSLHEWLERNTVCQDASGARKQPLTLEVRRGKRKGPKTEG
jgi:excisionase family DNA binding protein